MKIYNIMLFIFFFNIAIGMLNVTGAFPSQYQEHFDPVLVNTTTTLIAENATAQESQASQGLEFLEAVGDFANGLNLFVRTMALSIAYPAWIIDLSFPSSNETNTLSYLVNSIVYLIYAGGFIQFIAGRAFKANE